MLNIKDRDREFKSQAYGEFAAVTKALGSPIRLEILDLLIQGPLSVEKIALAIGLPIANTSQHLQVLKRSCVVKTERDGTTIFYRVNKGVAELFSNFRALAECQNTKLIEIKRDYYENERATETIDQRTLEAKLIAREAVLLDVRPSNEYDFAHILGARSIPIDELPARMSELPTDSLIVATCRGPYCVYAAQAVQALLASGREAVRFEGGVTEWEITSADRAKERTP